jgi:CHASE3 domain sensor protein
VDQARQPAALLAAAVFCYGQFRSKTPGETLTDKSLALLNWSPAVIAVLAAMIAAAAFWLGAREKADDAWMLHSIDVRRQLMRMLSLVQSAEIGQRGFLLTGEESSLAPYQMALDQLPTALDRTQRLVGDNPRQQQSLTQLRELVTAKLDELRTAVDDFKAGHGEEALAVVNSDSGPRRMQQIRTQFDTMQAEEDRLLAARQSSVAQLATLLQAGAAIAFLLICGLGILIARSKRETLPR